MDEEQFMEKMEIEKERSRLKKKNRNVKKGKKIWRSKVRIGRDQRKTTSLPNLGYNLSKKKVLAAIEGSGGILIRIAERLNVPYTALTYVLRKEDWADVKCKLFEEQERLADVAENRIWREIEFGDPEVATKNARWVLSRYRFRARGYGEQDQKITVGGGDPIQVQQTNLTIDALDLPLEVKKMILDAARGRLASKSRPQLGPPPDASPEVEIVDEV